MSDDQSEGSKRRHLEDLLIPVVVALVATVLVHTGIAGPLNTVLREWALATLPEGEAVRSLTPSLTWLLSVLVALLVPVVLLRLPPRWMLPAAVLALVLMVAATLVLLHGGQYWFPPGAVLVSVLVALPLCCWRRLAGTSVRFRGTPERNLPGAGPSVPVLEPASLDALVRMVRETLPVEAWRLVRWPEGMAEGGGLELPEYVWQGTRARHHAFRHEGQDYELALVWRQADPPPVLEERLARMVACCDAGRSGTGLRLMPDWMGGIEQRRRYRHALSELYGAGLEALPRAVVMADLCGRVLYVNPAARRELRLSPEPDGYPHLLELGAALFFPGEDHGWAGLVTRALKDGRVTSRGFLRDHELVLELSCQAPGLPSGELLVISFSNVGEERPVLSGPDSLRAALSHDLRSPLGSILALCEPQMRGEHSSEALIEQIAVQAGRALENADRFLRWTGAEFLELEKQPFLDFLAVVDDAFEEVRGRARDQNVELRFDDETEFPDGLWVRGDESLLRDSLVVTASAAIRCASPGARVGAVLRAAHHSVCWCLRVPDAGYREPWFHELLVRQGGDGAATNTGGRDLCLAALVFARHGGGIRVARDPGDMLLLEATLPVASVDDAE